MMTVLDQCGEEPAPHLFNICYSSVVTSSNVHLALSAVLGRDDQQTLHMGWYKLARRIGRDRVTSSSFRALKGGFKPPFSLP